MTILSDQATRGVVLFVLCALLISSAVCAVLTHLYPSNARFCDMSRRVKSWWVMSGIFAIVTIGGRATMIALFAVASWLALRELFISGQFERCDHVPLVLMSYALLPAYYLLIAAHATTAALVGFPLAMAGILVFAVINNPRVRKGRLFLSGSIAILGIGAVPLLLATSWPVTNEGLHLVLFVSLIVQITDCCQYMTGVTIGRTTCGATLELAKLQ